MFYGLAWTKALRASEHTLRAKVVASSIEDHRNNETGLCYPSLRTLMADTGLSLSSVKRAVRELEEAGWLIRSEGRGRGNHTHYTLVMQGKVVPIRPSKKGVSTELSTRETGSEKGSERTGKGFRTAPSHYKDNPPKEPKRAREVRRSPLTGPGHRASPPRAGAVICREDATGVAAWDEWLTGEGFRPLDGATFLAEWGEVRGYAVPSRYPPCRAEDAEKARAFFAAHAPPQATVLHLEATACGSFPGQTYTGGRGPINRALQKNVMG